MNQSLTCLNGERNSSTGRETSRYVSQQAGEPGGVADGGDHFSLVAFCVLGDWSERRKAHRMTQDDWCAVPTPRVPTSAAGICGQHLQANCGRLLLSQAFRVASGTDPQASNLASCLHRHLRPSSTVKCEAGPFSQACVMALKQPPTLV